MFFTLFGTILLIAPFLTLKRFENKKIGFVYITVFVLLTQLIIAISSQALHLFVYPVILTLNLIIFFISLYFNSFGKFSLKDTGSDNLFNDHLLVQALKKLLINLATVLKKGDLILIFIALITFTSLWLVHYRYQGAYTTQPSLNIVKTESPLNYPYPYFSDEWYAVLFIKDAISNQSLPTNHPIWHTPFVNLEAPFHSFLAEIVLLLRLDPLTDYINLSIFFNGLIIILIYLLLVFNKIRVLPAALASLSALYIANASNLPGLWTLLPLSLGLLCLLLTMIFYTLDKYQLLIISSFLTLIFYPPLVIFNSILIVFKLISKSTVKNRLQLITYYLITVVLAAAFISFLFFLSKNSYVNFTEYIGNKLFYAAFETNYLSSFPIYYVLPIPILLLSCLGFYNLFQVQKSFLVLLIVTLVFWVVYSFTEYRVIIDFPRLVITSAIFFIIAAGFGLNYLSNFFNKIANFKNGNLLISTQILILFLILPFTLWAMSSNQWEHFTYKKVDDTKTQSVFPLPNKYLHQDDVKIFSSLKNQRFLSIPWKGTVIAAATTNLPVVIKNGTIASDYKYYINFYNGSCQDKLAMVKNYKIEYIYFPDFNCPGFKTLGKSSEGFVLYKAD